MEALVEPAARVVQVTAAIPFITPLITGAALLLGVWLSYHLGKLAKRNERLEEKYAEVLAELTGLMFEVEDRYQRWYAPSLRGGHTRDEIKGKVAERGRATIESLNALTRCYHRNVAWLDSDIAARIDGSITELQTMLFQYGKAGMDNTYFHVSEEGVKAAKAMDERLPKLRQELVDEFREILRPRSWWKRWFGG